MKAECGKSSNTFDDDYNRQVKVIVVFSSFVWEKRSQVVHQKNIRLGLNDRREEFNDQARGEDESRTSSILLSKAC